MKKIILALMAALMVTGCTSPVYTADNGVTYRDYGLFNQQENQSPKVRYEPNWWNIAMGIIFFEMIIPPIYVFGFHVMEPTGLK